MMVSQCLTLFGAVQIAVTFNFVAQLSAAQNRIRKYMVAACPAVGMLGLGPRNKIIG